MEKKFQAETGLLKSAILFILFLIYTDLVCIIDVQPIGPTSTTVGFANLNQLFVRHIGVHAIFYTITDFMAILSFLVVFTFALLGLIQLIKRKSFFKVDGEIVMMGVMYVLVGIFYLVFEKVVINYRPVLIDGVLEASYPSSHTVLAVTVVWSALIEANRLLKNKKSAGIAVKVIGGVVIAITVVGRVLSGVHWFTDILGGILLSVFVVYFYCTLVKCYNIFLDKRKAKSQEE